MDIPKYSIVDVHVDTNIIQTKPDQTRIGDSSPSVSFPIRPDYSPRAVASAGLRAYYGLRALKLAARAPRGPHIQS